MERAIARAPRAVGGAIVAFLLSAMRPGWCAPPGGPATSDCRVFLDQYSVSGSGYAALQQQQIALRAIAARDAQAVKIAVLQGIPAAMFAASSERAVANATALEMKLVIASASGDLSQVQSDIDAGADINGGLESDAWMPALHWAAMCNQIAVARLLLEKGANPNLKALFSISSTGTAQIEGFTPLMAAATSGSVDTALLLLSHGADINAHADTVPYPSKPVGVRAVHGGTTALIMSNPTLVSVLLAAGARPNDVEADGRSALFWAASNGDLQSARTLLRAGADPCLRDAGGISPRQAAIESRQGEMQRLLASYSSACSPP